MIEVELRRPKPGDPFTAETVATLRMDRDGTKTLHDPHGLFPLELTVYDAAGKRWIRFDDDPIGWARNLHTELRTPYLFPVVTHDSERTAAGSSGALKG